jgi:hypothetical protein
MGRITLRSLCDQSLCIHAAMEIALADKGVFAIAYIAPQQKRHLAPQHEADGIANPDALWGQAEPPVFLLRSRSSGPLSRPASS